MTATTTKKEGHKFYFKFRPFHLSFDSGTQRETDTIIVCLTTTLVNFRYAHRLRWFLVVAAAAATDQRKTLWYVVDGEKIK